MMFLIFVCLKLHWLLESKVYDIYTIFDGKMSFGRKYDYSTVKKHEKVLFIICIIQKK